MSAPVSPTRAPEGAAHVGSHGFVRLVDVMGDDSSIVQAARVSYGAGTKSVNEDRGLIRYLYRHRHTTPFEMVVFKFHVKCPLFVARQWMRHRMGTFNEESGRYSVMTEETATYGPTEWRTQSKDNKQGSGGYFDAIAGDIFAGFQGAAEGTARNNYEIMIQEGVAREQARVILPVSTYTQFYWKVDLHNLLHFLGLRMDSHAQLEIRQFANEIGKLVEQTTPAAWSAFLDYKFEAMTLSQPELEFLRSFNIFGRHTMQNHLLRAGWLTELPDGQWKATRECQEFEQKLTRLGLPIHWRE